MGSVLLGGPNHQTSPSGLPKPLPPKKSRQRSRSFSVLIRPTRNQKHPKTSQSQESTWLVGILFMVYYNPVALVAGYHIEVRGVNGVNGCSSLKLGSTPMHPQPSIFPLSVLGSVVFVVTVPYRHPMVIVHSAYQTG